MLPYFLLYNKHFFTAIAFSAAMWYNQYRQIKLYGIFQQKKEVRCMDEKNKKPLPQTDENPAEKEELKTHTWVDDMKQELEDYIEDQGIYIRQ